ncbi:MAG: TetR/AcrR family transcriptional regulator [Chloroflexi bacterium]|nr:TetR/AcrR family transcriptional regulator [Chloroflexota bacterium]
MPKVINEDEVFKAVIALLVTRGYDRTTTSEMAAAANMHEATLFRKYGSKVGLIERAITHQLSETPLSKVRYSGDLRADLTMILEAYQATVAEHGEIMPMLLVEIPRHPELKNTLQAPLANIQGIIQIIERYQGEGLLKKEPPLITVNTLLGPLMVNEMYRRATDDVRLSAIEAQGYVEAFLYGRKS